MNTVNAGEQVEPENVPVPEALAKQWSADVVPIPGTSCPRRLPGQGDARTFGWLELVADQEQKTGCF
ncbi:MAG: hypothetical protein OEU78_10585, partial [Gammaproteobacteria bacterium]|nr:hypothetical protein [Gammaproteobacteria bacterium]